jgi:PAS domain S-box-containing protein
MEKDDDISDARSPERLLNALLTSLGQAVILVDPDGREILNCNPAAERVFGYEKEEMIGQSTEMLHVDHDHFLAFGRLSEQVLDQGEVFESEFQMKRKDDSVFDTYHTITPVDPELGWEVGVVSIVQDISKQKAHQRQVEESLSEKNSLLKELHHRVKNNLNVITSLLELQADQIENTDDAIAAFAKTRNRIFSMALVHEQLYHSERLNQIEMAPYIAKMAGDLQTQITTESGTSITWNLQIDDLTLDINRAIPCGLILNETISNALKHAYPDHEQGRISVQLEEQPDQEQYLLKISDNGVGMPADIQLEEPKTLGLLIVNTLVHQLKGKWHIDSSDGTRITVRFPQS